LHSCACLDLLDLRDVELVEQKTLVERLAFAAANFAQEVFLEGDLGEMNPFALGRPIDVAGWDLRLRQEAMPVSPKSARQIAFQVGCADGVSPLSSAPIFIAVAVTIDSIMNPVFGTPTGTGVAPTGAIATQTPIAKTFGNAGLR
jgi:hypothetical protein